MYRGGYEGARGSSQIGRIRGQIGTHPSGGRGQLYAIPNRHAAYTSDAVDAGVIFVYHRLAHFC